MPRARPPSRFGTSPELPLPKNTKRQPYLSYPLLTGASNRAHAIQRRRVESGLLALAHKPTLLSLQCIFDPRCNLLIFGARAYNIHTRTVFILISFPNRRGFGQRGQPAVLEQHGVCRAEFGDFVEAAADEITG
jgi:hypothetical protein